VGLDALKLTQSWLVVLPEPNLVLNYGVSKLFGLQIK